MKTAYRILDEPTYSSAGRFAMNPFWPLLAVMFAGAWLAALMFAVNAWALRGPTWKREIALTVGILLGAGAIALVVILSAENGILPVRAAKYALLAVVAWKLALVYWLYFLQQAPYSLFEHFERKGGSVQNSSLPLVLVGIGFYVSGPLLKSIDSTVLFMMFN